MLPERIRSVREQVRSLMRAEPLLLAKEASTVFIINGLRVASALEALAEQLCSGR
jgi:hypothetical protein